MEDLFAVLFIIAGLLFVTGFVLTVVYLVMKKPVKRALVVIALSFALAIVSFVGIGVHEAHVAKLEKQRIARQAVIDKAKRKKFDSAYNEFWGAAYLSATTSENLAQKVQDTWHDAIFEDAGATVAGKQYTDFNEAVDALITSESTNTDKISTCRDNMSDAMNTMSKNLTKPDAKRLQQVSKMATKTEKLASLATSPSGNYQTFGEKFSTLDSETADLLQDNL